MYYQGSGSHALKYQSIILIIIPVPADVLIPILGEVMPNIAPLRALVFQYTWFTHCNYQEPPGAEASIDRKINSSENIMLKSKF